MHSKLPNRELKQLRRRRLRKKTSRCLELYRAYSISFNPSKMLAIFLDLNFKELYYIEVQEKKKNVVVLCSRPRQDVKLGTFTLQSCQDG